MLSGFAIIGNVCRVAASVLKVAKKGVRIMNPKSVGPFCLILLWTAAASPSLSGGEKAAELVGASGVTGGLIVHVGCGDGQLTAALKINQRYVVQGLEQDAARVAEARAYLRRQG